MKKVWMIVLLLVVSFALIGCTDEAKKQAEEFEDIIYDKLPIYELSVDDTLVITATYPIWQDHSIRNGNIYIHTFTNGQVISIEIWSNGILKVVFADNVMYVHEYLSVEII